MTVEDILNLENKIESVRKIDNFLSYTKGDSVEYALAISYKCYIMHTCKKTKNALKTLLQYHANYSKLDEISIICINTLIKIFLEIKSFEEAYKYINIKRNLLKFVDEPQYYYDLVMYYEALEDIIELKKYLTLYINSGVDISKLLECYEKILLYEKNDDNLFFAAYDYLYTSYTRSFNEEGIIKIVLLKSNYLYDLKRYEEVLTLLNNEYSIVDNNLKIRYATILIKCYLATDELRKAMIIESEYEEYLEICRKDIQIEFISSSLQLYNLLNNKKSIEIYQNKFNELNSEKNSVKKTKKIDISKLTENISDKYEEVNNKTIEVSGFYFELIDFFKVLDIEPLLAFRDVLRVFGMLIEKTFSKCEIVLYLKKEESYYYKVGRVYEKYFSDNDLLDTPNLLLTFNENKLLIDNLSHTKNIITAVYYTDEVKLIGFNLGKNGSVIYVFKEEVSDEYIYEKLRILSILLNVNLEYYLKTKAKDDYLSLFDYAYNSLNLSIKIEENHTIKFNEYSKIFLNVSKTMQSNNYINLIDNINAVNYIKLYDDIYNHIVDNGSVVYKINNKTVNEFVFVKRGLNTTILSLILDITSLDEEKNSYKELSQTNNITNINNKLKLYNDLDCLDNQTFSIAIFEVKKILMYKDIYGYSFADEILYAISNKLLSICDKLVETYPYYLENDKFVILFKKTKDIRVLQKSLNKILQNLKQDVNTINYRLNLSFNCGCARILKSNIKKEKIMHMISDALLDSNEIISNDNIISVFNSETSNKRFFDSQMILNISEAIDQRKIVIKYRQIVDIFNNRVNTYYANLNLDNFNVDSNYFNIVSNQRQLNVILDKYLIEQVILQIKKFFEETKTYIKVMIPIHAKSFIDSNMYIFLVEKLKYYNISSNLISLHIVDNYEEFVKDTLDDLMKLNINLACSSLDYLFRYNLNILLLDFSKVDNSRISSISKLCEDTSIALYAYNVTSKEQLQYCSDSNITIVFGDIYNKLFFIDDLIKFAKK